MKAARIRIEGLKNPLGIDIPFPRITWNCDGGVRQSAYRVILKKNGEPAFDSNKVLSSSMHFDTPIPLSSREEVEVSIVLYDENDVEGEPVHARFEMGLLHPSDWKASWITGAYSPKKKNRYPVDCFKKEFVLRDVEKARLYATACGIYEIKLNGKAITDTRYNPGYTDYRVRVHYQTYDVTPYLEEGKNVLEVSLSDGWYRGSVGAWGLRNEFGTVSKFLLQLEADTRNGPITLVSDSSWGWSNDGPIREADLKDGEIVDARMVPSYAGKAKKTSHKVVPSAPNVYPAQGHETFLPTLLTTPSGKKVLDFHQNFQGVVRFALNAHDGEKVSLRFGEMLDKNGEFTQTNIQCRNKKGTKITPKQEVTYLCKEGLNEYETRFAVFGFRYVLIETDIAFKPEDFLGIAIYSSMPETGTYSCDSELVNRFVDITRWSAKSNHLFIPTDCPTRERHGWSGDAQIFAGTASYLFDFDPFARKYVQDLYDWQKKDGKLPQIAPYGGVDFYMDCMNGSVGWADAGVIIPYKMYARYGDKKILETHYEGMRKYARFMERRFRKWTPLSHPVPLKRKERKYVVNYGQCYGEWAEPADVYPNHWTNVVFPEPEVATAYTHYVMTLMEKIAKILGKEEDAAHYADIASKTKESYIALRNTKPYTLDTDRQARLVRPLYFHLLDEKQEEYAKKRLIEALDHYGWRLGTGFLSTPLILDVLSDIDIEFAYKLLENEEMPGWLFMPKSGSTTVWESWEGTEAQGGIASLNHYSKGAVVEWLFASSAGIKVDGERHFLLAPRPGGHIDHVDCSYRSAYGRVASSFHKEGEKYAYSFLVPPNCTATILLNGVSREVGPGEHAFLE